MNSNNHTYFTNDIMQNLKDGTEVILFEKERGKITNTIVAKMVNVIKVHDDYKFNLINTLTDKMLLKEKGEPRAWYLKKALELGTISISKSENLLLCPSCKKNLISKSQTICYDCKREEKKNFFSTKVKMDGVPFLLDNEQTDAVLADRHALVTARAGSGKTRVLTAKLIDLFFNQGIRQDEVLAFCFNRDAASEIRKRLNSECTIDGKVLFKDYDVVTTFHSYAVDCIRPKIRNILTDEHSHNRTHLIKEIINHFRDTKPKFEECLREYFLENTLKIDRQRFKSMEHYYHFVRNSRYRTLNGEHVRSIPEKIIADFLFEHQIEYQYEPRFYLTNADLSNHNLSNLEFDKFTGPLKDKNETVPDFYLPKYKILWEHWGITGKEAEKEKEEFTNSVCNYNEYLQNMEWKRSFWNNWRYKLITNKRYVNDFSKVSKLIETNPDDFKAKAREQIEGELKKLLESKGVLCRKLSEEEIMKKVWEKAEDYFTSQIRQFIDKFQQQYIGNERVFEEKARSIKDEREKTFLRLGYMVYKEYNKVLRGEAEGYNKYKGFNFDYNLCLKEATTEILSGTHDNRIKQLKWILIDEYQDFSELFFNLISAILLRNPNIILFCVGDDWQAINRFAGSDLKYFENFSKYFPNSVSYNITTNYRCEDHIVTNAGEFMRRFKVDGKSQRGFLENTGVFEERYIAGIKPEDANDYKWLFMEGGCWKSSNDRDVEYNSAYHQNIMAYMKFCSEIINQNPEKTIKILTRTRKFLGKDLDEIKGVLKKPKLCKIDNPKVEVKTAHQSKGEEADIVILTEVDENHFPIFHPDSNLFGVFGENEYNIMEDEIRLYYVALTRAKHSIYVLYSKDTPSCFIKKQPKKLSFKHQKQKL